MEKKTIYGLVDPRDGSVRYIGASATPGLRYEQHLATARDVAASNPWKTPKDRQAHQERWAFAAWLYELHVVGLRPDLRLFTGEVSNWRQEERRLQAELGAQLLNPNDQAAYYQREDVSAMVGQHLARARASVGLTQSEAATRLDTSQGTISRWETGERNPSLRQLYRIGAAYGIPTGSLLPEFPSSEGASHDATKARGES